MSGPASTSLPFCGMITKSCQEPVLWRHSNQELYRFNRTLVATVTHGTDARLIWACNQYTTSADINQQYEKNSVDILPNFLRIYRENEHNLDVAGNTSISLSLLADPDRMEGKARYRRRN